MPDSETIPDLLDRLEREHVRAVWLQDSWCKWCRSPEQPWPCGPARVVAHARGLQRAFDAAEHQRELEVADALRRRTPEETTAYYLAKIADLQAKNAELVAHARSLEARLIEFVEYAEGVRCYPSGAVGLDELGEFASLVRAALGEAQ